MNPSLTRVEAIFNEAIELSPEARSRFLAEACRGDAELEKEVAELLAHDDGASKFLGGLVDQAVRDAAVPDLSGHRVGDYLIERELGRGGMGTVYMARRADDQFEAEVAVKVVRGLADAEQLRRFAVERQALARIDHPNIARLIDAGTTDDGVPYVVMELVSGVSVTDYCQGRPLDARLECFLAIADALTTAHQSLVVHRDLKPANVLVTARGTPKVLDFGIAKLLVDGRGQAETQTEFRALTPAYASPEQFGGDPITVATDVHGLGLLLYEMLTGALPYRLSGLPVDEQARVVKESERPAPSRTAAAAPKAGAVDAGRLRGDLDTIVLRAIDPDPQRRYLSAEAFAEDVRRFRAGQPVRARPDSWRYRLRKLVERNALAFASAACVGVLLLAGALALAVQSGRIARERDVARSAQAEAEAVAGFLVRLFEGANPQISGGEDISARELLDRGAARLDVELADQPSRRARLMEVAAEAYQNLGDYAQARAQLELALEIRETASEPGPALAKPLTQLGDLLGLIMDRADEARPLLDRAISIAREAGDDEALGDALETLANVGGEEGKWAQAEPLLRESLGLARSAPSPASIVIARRAISLGSLLRRASRYDEAEALLREGHERFQKAHGGDHLEVGHALNQLARLLVLRGRPEEAEPLAREGLRIRRKNFGAVHIEVAASLGTWAGILRALGRYEEAVKARQEVVSIIEETVGDAHPYTAASLSSLGAAQHSAGDMTGAEASFRRSLALHRELLASGDHRLGHPLTGLGEVLLAAGHPEEAEPLLEEALALRREALPEGHPFTAETALRKGELLLATEREAEAEALLESAHATLEEARGREHPSTQRAARALARARARTCRSSGPSSPGCRP